MLTLKHHDLLPRLMIQRQKGVPAWWNYDEWTTKSPPSHARDAKQAAALDAPRHRVRARLALLLLGPAGMSIADEFRANERHKMVEEIVALARVARRDRPSGARRARARCDAQGAAPRVRAGRAEARRLPQPAAADRRGPDDLAALHRRADDGPAGARARRTRCSRSAPGAGYQAAVLAELRRQGPQHRDRRQPWAARRRQTLARLGYDERRDAHRRRLRGLAGGGAVRRHHRHRGAGPHPAGADRAAEAGRTSRHPGRQRWRKN